MFFAQRLWCFFARFSIINWAIGFARFSLINGETPFFLMSAGIMLFWKKHYIFSKNRVKIQTMQDGKYSWDRWGAIQIFPTLDLLTAERKSTGFVCWLVIAELQIVSCLLDMGRIDHELSCICSSPCLLLFLVHHEWESFFLLFVPVLVHWHHLFMSVLGLLLACH